MSISPDCGSCLFHLVMLSFSSMRNCFPIPIKHCVLLLLSLVVADHVLTLCATQFSWWMANTWSFRCFLLFSQCLQSLNGICIAFTNPGASNLSMKLFDKSPNSLYMYPKQYNCAEKTAQYEIQTECNTTQFWTFILTRQKANAGVS